MSEPERREEGRPVYAAEAVRQGRIVLNTPRRRAVFIASLAVAMVGGIVIASLA